MSLKGDVGSFLFFFLTEKKFHENTQPKRILVCLLKLSNPDCDTPF